MRMNDSIRSKKSIPRPLHRGVLIAAGVGLILLSIVVLSLSLWESFFKSGHIQLITVPGFQQLQLDTPGLYVGLYQHQGPGPIPIKQLSELDVRILSKTDYESIPVVMNTQGQTFERLGMRGMPVFNFFVETPGAYTMSAILKEDDVKQEYPIMIIPQSTQNIKQNLIVGVAFFIFFLASGIFILIRIKRWCSPS